MKLLKKSLSILLAVVLLCSLLPQTALAAQAFRLGTDSAELLYTGGSRVKTERGEYFLGEDGFVCYEEDGQTSLVAELAAANLNYDSGTLYFTVQGDTSFALWAYDGSLSCLTEIAGRVKQLYIANGDTAYYSIGAAVWQLPLGGRAKIVYENEALFSFVPTQYGIVAARGTAAEYTLFAGETKIVDFCDRYSVDFDADGGRIYYHDYFGDHQLDLAAAFNGTAVPEEYTGFGEVDAGELLSGDYEADERELAFEEQTAQNAAANNKRALNGPQASASAKRGNLSQGQKNAQKRAYQMTDILWTPKGNILGWKSGLTYTSGTTYTGLPYGQPVDASYVPWSTDLTGFINAVNNASSKMYTSYAYYNNNRAPYYSIDCSAFVSWALNMDSRKTTASIAGSTLATLISETSYANIQVGDFLNKSGSHVVMCTDITYDTSGNINGIEISESTVVAATNYCCQRTWYGTGFGSNTLSYFTTKYFGGGYKLYRSKTISNVGYSHVCVSPIAGDECSVCGYGSDSSSGGDSSTKFGIDVSYAQGTINWDLVAPQIDFAIIRCGYGSDITSQDDNQWVRNVSECERLGIPYGVYLFSYADTDAKAASEAQHVLRLLSGHHPTLPVFYDLESSTTQACGNANILNFARIFCNAIEDAGYDAGVYANLNWWRNYLTSSEYDQWYRWVAQYNSSCTYTGTYVMWQNSSTYTMSGITGNTVDTDYWYGAFPGQDTPPVSGDYTVTFKVPTDYAPVSAQGVTAGQSITLPSISTKHCGYTFMGWTTSAVSATTTQPEFYYAGQSFTPTKNTTLRAVFKYYKNGNSVVGDIYYPPCSSSQTGLAAALDEVGAVASNLAYRRDYVAVENFVYNYSGTADQNTYLLGLLKAGMLVNPAKTANYTAYYNTTPGVCHRATTETTVAATCTTPGTKVTSCAYCGYNKTTEVAALGHNDKYVSNGNGTHTHSCSRCDTVLAAAEACTFESGYCTLCGGAQMVGDFSGTYYIAAKRTNDTNYQYLTNTVSSNRLSIEDSGVTVLPTSIASPEANKTFTIIADGSGKYTIRADGTAGTANYIGWKQATSSAANNAILVAADSAVHADITGSSAGYVNISFTDTADTLRYLAFNSTATNRYCCWYASQMKNLYLIPVTGSLPTHTHSYTSAVTTPATCTTAGVCTYTCSCGDTYSEAISALGHDMIPQTPVAATCTTAGYTPRTCSRCDETDQINPVAALGHIDAYTSNGDGTHRYYCSRCNETLVAAQPCIFANGVCTLCGAAQPISDFSGTYYIAAKRTSDTYYHYLTNSVSSNRLSIESSGLTALPASIETPEANKTFTIVRNSDDTYSIRADGTAGTKNFVGWSSGNTAILVAEGSAVHADINSFPAGYVQISFTDTADTLRYLAFNSTATNRYCCWYASQMKNLYLIPVTGSLPTHTHSYTSAVTTPATCTTAGVETFTCECGDTYTEPIPALQHDYIYDYVDPTCTERGYTRATCSRCDYDEILDYSYVAALGHDWDEQTPIAPTCTEEGYTPLVCSRCDATDLTDIVDELGHIYDYADNGNGTHKYYCTRCNTVFDAAEECVYEDGVCIGCGHIQVTANIGDYVRVTTAPSDWSGTYLIVCENNSSAFNGSLASPNVAGNYNAVTISDGIVTGSETIDSYAVTIAKIAGTDTYTICLSNGKYMGTTGSSTGINASSTKYPNAISLDANGNAIIANTTGTNTYNFRFNSASSSNRFAFYGTSTGYAVKLYKYQECPHNWSSEVTTAATCTAAGETTFTCSICGKTYTETIPALGHDVIETVIPETCVTLGRTVTTCSRCDYRTVTFVQTVKWSSWSATDPQIDDPDLVKTRTAYRYRDLVDTTAPVSYVKSWPAGFNTANALYTQYNIPEPEGTNETVIGYIYWHWCRGSYTGGPIDRKIQPAQTTECSSFAAFFSATDPTTLSEYSDSANFGGVRAYNYPNAEVCKDSYWWYATPVYSKDVTTSDWGAWSTWTGTERIPSETKQVETRTEYQRITTQPNGEHHYVDGICEYCGDVLQTLSIESAALVLNGKIDVVYTAAIPDGYTNARMVFTMNGESVPVSDDGSHTFTFTGVNPQCMGDNITATLYATKNGTEESISKNDYSVRQYCVNQLSKTTDAKLRKLLSDMLAYGAAAQTYMNYKTNALVNEGSDIVNPTYSTFTSLSGLAASFSGTAADGLAWAGVGLTLTDGVAMNFRFYAASTSGLSVKVTLGSRTETFTTFTTLGNGVYEISFTGINADEFADSVSASFYRNNAKTGETVSYSVNTYVCAKQTDSNTALADLVKALYNYGASAAAYAD